MCARLPHVVSSCLLLLLVLAPVAAGDAEDDWREGRKAAKRLMDMPGQLGDKEVALGLLGKDDSPRAAELLIEWCEESLTMLRREIGPEFEETREKLEKYEKQLRKAYVEPYTDANRNDRYDEGEKFKDRNANGKRDGWPPRTMNADHRNAWNGLKNAHQTQVNHVETERLVQARIGGELERFTSIAAVRWLASEGIDDLDKAEEPGPVRLGIVGALLGLSGDWRMEALRRLAAPGSDPKARIRILNWAGQEKAAELFDVAVEALDAKHMAVRRGAVAALKAYDDPRAVEPLIEALADAEDLLQEEIEEVLHWYTGRSFEGVAKIWKKWFRNEGQTWLEQGDKKRYAPQKVTHAGTTTRTTFYDIPTQSKRIVFVLDRSGSMKTPASHSSQQEKKDKKKPRGPITGGGGKGKSDKDDGDDDGPIAGDTKLEVAKNKLRMTVSHLDRDIRFGLVFYSTGVEVWKPAPELEWATKSNKDEAIKWFMDLAPDGSTSLFPALMEALAYADSFGAPGDKQRKRGSSGANTIFLLSDGSPTVPGGGKPLPAAEVDRQLEAFMEANKIYRCVVHTIGVGPQHNRSLMQRIASATGGTYKAVGAN